METFQIKEFSEKLGEGPRLRHILALYEEIEAALFDIEVEKTDSKQK